MIRKIRRFKADPPAYLWYLRQQVNRHSVDPVEVNPETVEGDYRCISEPATPFRGGRFVPIMRNSFHCEGNSSSEARD